MIHRLAFGAALLVAVGGALSAQTTNTAPATNAATATAPTNPYPDAISVAQINSAADGALTEFPAPDSSQPNETANDIRNAMRLEHPELQAFSDRVSQDLAQNPSLDLIRTLESNGAYFSSFPASWTTTLATEAKHISQRIDDLAAAQKKWTDTKSALAAKDSTAPADLTQRANEVLARLATVKSGLNARQSDLLALQTQASNETTLVNDALNHLANARDHAVNDLYVANTPPVWSSGPTPEVNDTSRLGWSKQWISLVTYVESQPAKFVLHALLLAALIGVFFWLHGFARKLVADEPGIARAAHIFKMPVSAGLLLSLFASWFLYYPIAPRLLFAIIGAIALVPSVVLLRHFIERRMFPVLYALVVFFFLEEFRSVASFSPAGERAFLLAEILGAVIFLAWLLLSLRRATPTRQISRTMRIAGWIAFLTLAAGWIAEVLGYTQLASVICIGVQRAATMGLALYASVRVIEALLFILVRLRPLSQLAMVQQHRTMLLRRSQRILTWVAGLWWAFLVLEMIPARETVLERLFGSPMTNTSGWLGHYRPNQPYVLNLAGKLVVAALIIWVAFQISRFARFVLEAEFFPRLRLSAGVPYAISMSLHYAVLVLAFVAATYALGIDMTKFTILVSALGVGVGFGLQNIINNFVSGLILLFERPIKVGDTILTGTDTGTVERIGIRASILRTPSGTEVIVPNGTLISNNVTNWTLSTSERIILIPLNVPRGPEIRRLIEIVTTAAASRPDVLRQPAPQVLAQTLGANLGLELRAWTDADDWTRVRSEVLLAVNAALAKESIALA